MFYYDKITRLFLQYLPNKAIRIFMTQENNRLSHKKLNLETSKMPWHKLQRFFAKGHAIFIADDLDLIEVAYQFSQDNKNQVKTWMKTDKVSKVSDSQAQKWIKDETILWAVVIKPWILVQDKK